MGKVIADQSLSLDRFSAGPHVGVGNGMGDGGDQLHGWMFSEEDGVAINAGVREDTPFTLLQRSGAVMVGRRMFDVREEEPMGDGGERLHAWQFGPQGGADWMAAALAAGY